MHSTNTSGFVIQDTVVSLAEPTVQQLLQVVQEMLATSVAVEVLRTSDSMNGIPTCNANAATDILRGTWQITGTGFARESVIKHWKN